ncbi:ABC transporter ATP-binding protein [Cytobacillus sp. Hz8]|uniref:ABC transporter ATP-binding protein n=1 Tax=Cytobacillus sp. Hz8 TaxID=3347168 RepID=UPI0035D6D53C
MSILSINKVSFGFQQQPVLKDFSLTVNEGEFISVLGPSGSGKSTLLHLIGGTLTPDNGIITLNKEMINGKRGLISYMPQTPSLFPWRTILKNVTLGQEIKGKIDHDKAIEMLQKAGLGDYLKAYPDELSGGMKQRVSFIRALLSPQSVILLDEPFSALDEFTKLEMQKWLLSIWESNRKTILFVTHSIEEALFLSDRIVVLTNKPASIARIFDVPYTRPRSETLLLEEQFLEWKKSIYYTLTAKDRVSVGK